MKLSEAVKLTPPKILLYAAAGGWKTTFATSWGSVSEIIDVDKKLLPALKVQDKWTSERQQVDVFPCYDIGLQPSAFDKAKGRVFDIAQQCAVGGYKPRVLIIDSLTTLGEHALRKVLGNSGKLLDQKNPNKIIEVTQREWGLAINDVENVLTVLRSLPVAVIVIAHVLTENVDGMTKLRPWAIGQKLPDKLSIYFDEIWHTKIVPGPSPKCVIQSQSTGSVQAVTRGQLPNDWDVSGGLKEALKLIGYE